MLPSPMIMPSPRSPRVSSAVGFGFATLLWSRSGGHDGCQDGHVLRLSSREGNFQGRRVGPRLAAAGAGSVRQRRHLQGGSGIFGPHEAFVVDAGRGGGSGEEDTGR
jgi:hypothetical protein